MLCASCNKNKAPIHRTYGVMWCNECNKKKGSIKRGLKYPEFTTDSIRESRKQFRDDILQPLRGGEFSKEFRDAHPKRSKEMVEAGSITQKQYDKAKEVWHGDI